MAQIPKEVFEPEETILLDLEIGGEAITIKRNRKEADKPVTAVISKNKKELTQEGKKKISDVRAEWNALEDEFQKLEDAMESFKTNETFDSMEAELI